MSLLDFDLMKDEEENLEIVAALQSSQEGEKQYEQLCVKRNEFLNMVINSHSPNEQIVIELSFMCMQGKEGITLNDFQCNFQI